MMKSNLLFGLLLAMPVQAMTLPLSPATQAYADTLTSLTICYPALIRPPYLEESGGLLIDQLDRLAEQLPVPLLHEKLPNWPAVQQALLAGRCDLIPDIGPSRQALPGMALSRALLPFFTRVSWSVPPSWCHPFGRRARCSRHSIPIRPSGS
ncbi:hypothetical protein LGKMAHEF_02283 [Aeromonas salmonicida]|uniref:PAS, putative n=1 Tax=Aeromonas salmonicida subsp. salmonicida 01-B526 TaxID=1076135 RepID=A0ABN0DZ65_AERSS|nr:PAS, putative [Aeromonas salmonicida subsp. salmonicida 01-B526]SPT67494.1 Uncharacterised protein [Aeromonas salmonicida]SUU71598.1 Uncharacterised protein [Aeromonas salmonicida]